MLNTSTLFFRDAIRRCRRRSATLLWNLVPLCRSRILFLFLLLAGLTAQAQKNWVGSTNDWNTATNWNPVGIPTASDNVVIPSAPANQPLLSTTAVANSVDVKSGASLTITAAGILTLTGSTTFSNGPTTQTTAFNNLGLVDNSGRLTIDNTANAGSSGIHNAGTFNSHMGGEITIDRPFLSGVLNRLGTFTNSGRLIIGANASVGAGGINNIGGTFINNAGGEISIDRNSLAGLLNGNGTFTNSGRLTIGANANVGSWGIDNESNGEFINNLGGEISIDRSRNAGISNGLLGKSTFTNSGRIIIGANASVGSKGIDNISNSTFSNTGCSALINIVADAIISNTSPSSFTNSGTIIENATGNSTISANTGIVQNLNGGTFDVGSGPNAAVTTAGNTWKGCTSTDWNTATNWSSGVVPTASDDVVIPADPVNQPVLSTTAVAHTVEVMSGASLTITAAGSMTLSGTKDFGSSTNTTAFLNQGLIDNSGELIVGYTTSSRNIGLVNRGIINNRVGGQIIIDYVITSGIYNNGGAFNNYAKIAIGTIQKVDYAGIINDNGGAFTNYIGGEITVYIRVDFVPAVQNHSGTFTNYARITIDTPHYSAISNSDTFNNSGCSAIIIVVGNSTVDGINNTGIIITNATVNPSDKLWLGCTSTDWNTGTNWLTGTVPTATDNVVIPAGAANPPILSTTAVAYSVEVMSGASLTITSAGSLSLTGSKAVFSPVLSASPTTAFFNGGQVDNNGRITVIPMATINQRALSLHNVGTFNNLAGGEIVMDGSVTAGLYNRGGTFTNYARISLGATVYVGFSGIFNGTLFTNYAGGAISIDRVGQYGVNNSGGTFTNKAKITIGTNIEATVKAIETNGAFTNDGCSALINVLADAIISTTNPGSFTNTGTIIENSSGNSTISNNTGIVQNLNGGTFDVGSGPNAAVTTPGNIWKGCTSTDWNTGTNWSSGVVPTASDHVVIPAGSTNQPVLSTMTEVNSVEVMSGASLTVTTAASLTLNGTRKINSNVLSDIIVFHNEGFVDNSGRLILPIKRPANEGREGIRNVGMFSNRMDGEIIIDNATGSGLYNREGTFNNYGRISIGVTVNAGLSGLNNQATFNNHVGGDILIQKCGWSAIANSSNFTNYAKITIGANFVGSQGVIALGGGIFSNDGCSALISILANAPVVISSGSFVNSGTIIDNSGSNNYINNGSNTGIIQSLNGGRFSFWSGPNQPLSLSSINASSCPANGAITISGLHANTTYTLSYTVGGNSVNVSPNPTSNASGQFTVGNLAAGTYALTLNGSCVPLPLSLSANLSGPASVTPTLVSSGTLTCANPSVTLTAGGGTSYTLTGGSGTQTSTTGQFVVSQGGSYTVLVANIEGCTATTNVVVSADQTPPTVSINQSVGTTLTCSSPMVSLLAVGSGTYRWSTGATTSSISVSVANTYSVTLTSANGCTASASAQVNSDQTPPAIAISSSNATLTCSSPIASLSAVGVGTYRWSTGATTSSISVSTATTYSVTLTSANGCTSTVSTTISLNNTPPPISINPSSATLSCTTSSVSLSAVGVGTYRWSNGATTSTISVSVANTYSVTLIGANGCTSTASASVTYQNCVPTVANAIPPKSATIGDAFSYTIPATTFTDAETPTSLTLSVSGLPAGLSFVSPNTITGVASTTLGSPSNVTVIATDPGGLSVATSFALSVQPRGFAITGVTMLDCNHLSYYQRRINFTVSFEATNGQPISLSVVNEVPAIPIPEPYQLTVFTDNPVIVFKARQQGTPGEATFSYNWLAHCANGNPRVENSIPPVSATVGQAFSYTIPATTFTDAETPNSLSLSVVGLPAGLSLVSPNLITGVVSGSASSFYSVTVIASDGSGDSVSTIWPLSVVNGGGCVTMYSVKAGEWSDASVWSCGRVPVSTDVVTLHHAVSLPAAYVGESLRLLYSPTGRLLMGATSRLRLGGN